MTSKAAALAAKWWGDRLQSGDRVAFEETLALLVDKALMKYGECRLSCDYDPDDLLLEAVRAAGVQCSGCMFSARGILPQKHQLKVFTDHLECKEGYGSWTTDIKVNDEVL